MRVHLVNTANSQTTEEWSASPYVQKVRKLATALTTRGHEVMLYASDRHDGECSELICCTTELTPDSEEIDWDPDGPGALFNAKAIEALRQRVQPRDLILLSGGYSQHRIAEAFPGNLIVEPGIGYSGVLDRSFRVWESYAWMHCVLGQGGAYQADGRFFDTVIPNLFDPAELPPGNGEGGYLLYLGRLIDRKGVRIAIETARAAGLPLKVAGVGDYVLPDDVEYLGLVRPAERAQLMGEAIALLAPTVYVEPFGGVAVEAQLTGTPAITTDWGAFTETVQHGIGGFRCHTLAEFVEAAHQAPGLDRDQIHQHALEGYSLDAVAPMYERYFKRLDTLWANGWYELSTAEPPL